MYLNIIVDIVFSVVARCLDHVSISKSFCSIEILCALKNMK